MSKETGGPAFPVTEQNGANFGDCGLSLRDFFAAKADMAPYNPRQTLESKLDRKVTVAELADYIAATRYIEADAMIAERAK